MSGDMGAISVSGGMKETMKGLLYKEHERRKGAKPSGDDAKKIDQIATQAAHEATTARNKHRFFPG